jgi:hypothetical protein
MIQLQDKLIGPLVTIKTSCYSCKYLISKEQGEKYNDIPDGDPPLLYSCKNSNKVIGYIGSIDSTPDWCEFKSANIATLLNKIGPISF